jgi:hypothetical protein
MRYKCTDLILICLCHDIVEILLKSVRLSVRSHFCNRYLSFYWKKWLHIYFLFTVRLTNERVGVFLARRSVQHLVHHCFKRPICCVKVWAGNFQPINIKLSPLLVTATCLLDLPSSIASITSSGLETNRSVAPYRKK